MYRTTLQHVQNYLLQVQNNVLMTKIDALHMLAMNAINAVELTAYYLLLTTYYLPLTPYHLLLTTYS